MDSDLNEYGIHIALSHLPMGKEDEFVNGIATRLQNYKDTVANFLGKKKGSDRNSIKEYLEHYYDPKVFLMFGHFDVAIISFFNSFKFPQRLVQPHRDKKPLPPASYQILSGVVLNPDNVRKFQQLAKKPFIFTEIVHLKLNNFLLIGQGRNLFEPVVEKICTILGATYVDESTFLLIDSHNWAELILVFVGQKAGQLVQDLLTLLEIKLLDLAVTDEDKRSFRTECLGSKVKNMNPLHELVFVESHSYLGVEYTSYHSKNMVPNDVELTTVTEWEILPGNFHLFKDRFNKVLDFESKQSKVWVKLGKTDYVIKETDYRHLSSNQSISKILVSESATLGSSGRNFVKKIKTTPLFELPLRPEANATKRIGDEEPIPNAKLPEMEDFLTNYTIKERKTLKDLLLMLKQSRNVRKKVQKILFNYNLGIVDPVLFIYFIDVYPLLNRMIADLKTISKNTIGSLRKASTENSGEQLEQWSSIETGRILDEFGIVFEEAIEDRILNNYNYEDINEFSLHLNSSNASLVSALDSIIKFVATCVGRRQGDTIVTRIGDNLTQANKISVNYNIHHITTPSLIFATLMKEVLNLNSHEQSKDLWKHFNAFIDQVEKMVSTDLYGNADDLLETYNFDYFEVDLKKYHLTFFENWELYEFWHWTYAFQSAHMYSTIGNFDEQYFVRELIRLLLIWYATGNDKQTLKPLSCPLPEIRTYWNRYFYKLSPYIKEISATKQFRNYVQCINDQVSKICDDLPQNAALVKDVQNSIQNKGAYHALKHLLKPQKFTSQLPLNTWEGFVCISRLSYSCLTYIHERFSHNKIALLRRNYLDGKIMEGFLENDQSWYVDPLGGFFINDPKELNDYLRHSKDSIFELWSLGTQLKLLSFTNSKSNAR
jgi:hypothetical protein